MLGGFATGVLALMVVWLFIQVGDLRREVEKLRQATAPRKRAAPIDAIGAARTEPGASDDPVITAEIPNTPDPIEEKPETSVPVDRPVVQPAQPGFIENGITWVMNNWVLAVAGVSLALAAVFLVQYGIENGLLGPAARVAASALLGAVLLGAAEYLRRYKSAAAGYIPTVFAAAGIVALFVAAFSAHVLYSLIGPGAGFLALSAVAILGVFGGWLYGPFLSALSLVGGFAVPFLVASPDDATAFIYAYPVLLAVTAMMIDSLRGWIWVSVLGLIGGFASTAIFQFGGVEPAIAPFAYTAMVLIAPYALYLSFNPAPNDPIDWGHLLQSPLKQDWAQWDLRVVIITVTGVAGLAAMVVSAEGWPQSFMPIMGCFAAIIGLYGLVLSRAGALAAVTWAGALSLGAVLMVTHYPNALPDIDARRLTDYPFLMIMLATIALIALLVWRTTRASQVLPWALVTGLTPSLIVFALQSNWYAADALTDWGWALHIMTLAGVMTLATVFLARHANVGSRGAAYLALSALGLMAYGLFAILSGAALTMALAVTTVAAAWLDRCFDLRPVTLFIIGAGALVSARLFFDPAHIAEATNFEFALLVITLIPAFALTLLILQGRRIYPAEVVLVGLVTLSLTMFTATIARLGDALNWDFEMIWAFCAIMVPLLAGFFGQAYLAKRAQHARWIRVALASILGVFSLLFTVLFLILSPLLANEIGTIRGVVFFNSSTVAFLGTAALIFAGLRFVNHLPKWVRWIAWMIAGAFALAWGMMQVRMLFHTAMPIDRSGFVQPELYTYTIVMLIGAAALMYQSVAKQSTVLRRVALGLLAVTIAKVFLIDITELTGLFRVLAFLVLGLSLAGIAWLDGWLAQRAGVSVPPASAKSDPPEPDA